MEFNSEISYLKCTVCPGSSDPPEKIFNIFASENEVTPFINYYNTLGHMNSIG